MAVLPHNHDMHTTSVLQEIPDVSRFQELAEVFRLLSDGSRMRIFWLLCHCEECVVNLSVLLQISSSAVSHHLKLLKDSALAVSRREGKEVYYTAAGTPKADLLHTLIEQVAEVSCPVEEVTVQREEYDSNVRTVRQIHEFMIQNIHNRYTIEELSQRFLINPTTLKTTFKSVYSQPIAAYMKAYRIKQAQELLLHTDRTAADIAQAVGYGNQSKFSQAFKDLTGMLPREYRKCSGK